MIWDFLYPNLFTKKKSTEFCFDSLPPTLQKQASDTMLLTRHVILLEEAGVKGGARVPLLPKLP